MPSAINRVKAFGLLLLGLPSSTLAKPIEIQPRQNVPGDTPFVSFDACSDSQRQDIEKAWADVVTLVGVSKQFNPPGTIESRIFGDDINLRFEDISRIYSESLCFVSSGKRHELTVNSYFPQYRRTEQEWAQDADFLPRCLPGPQGSK